MPDIRQALKDLVETSNSGRYDEATLMSKFPELKGYDIGVLKDFVATANSGNYQNEDELFGKFPEFNLGGPVPQVKKNSQLPLVSGSQGSTPTEELAVGNLGITGLQKVKKPEQKVAPLQAQSPKFVSDLTSAITPEEISKQEETLVPEMNYKYGPLGFKFEESGYTGNYMKVVAPNGKDAIEVSLGLGAMNKKGEAEKLKKFIQDNSKTVATDRLSTIEEEYKTSKKVYNSQKEIDDTVKTLNKDAEDLMAAQKVWAKQQDEHSLKVEKFNKLPEAERSLPQYDALIKERDELNARMGELISGVQDVTNKEEALKTSVGRYKEMQSQKGAWYETVPMALARGAGKLASGFYGQAMDLINEFGPKEMLGVNDEWWQNQSLKSAKKLGYGEPSEGQNATQFLYNLPSQQKSNVEADVRDVLKKRDKGFMVGGEANDPQYLKEKFIELASKKGIEGPKSKTDEAYVSWLNTLSEDVKDELDVEVKKQAQGGQTISEALRNTLSDVLPTVSTKEYYEKTQQKFVPGAVLGAIESVPAFMFGNKFTRLARLFAQADDATFAEMEKDPDFKDISENEKRLISMPISIATAVLEEVGFRNIISNKGLLNRITLAALRKSGATTTAKTFGELVRNEVDGMVAKGALTLVGASLAEAETGALQQVADIAVKEIYNEVKDKRMFDTPESVGEFVADVVKAGVQEAIGGFVLGTPSAVGAAYAKKGFLNMSDEQFRQFESMANDSKLQTAFVTSLKNKILNGEISRSEAKEQLNDYRNSVSLYNQLPDNLSIQGKKEAMNLIKEKNALKQQIEGKDDALVVNQKERIAAIDVELGEISKTKTVTNFNEEETVKLAGILLQEKKRQEDVKNYKRKKFLGRDLRLGALEFYKSGLADFEKRKKETDKYSDEEIESITNELNTRISLLERSLEGTKPITLNQITDNAIQEQGAATGVPSTEQPQLGLQEMGQGNAQPQGTPPGTEEVVAPQPGQEEVVLVVAPEPEVTTTEEIVSPKTPPIFSLDGIKRFFHASSTPRSGRLKASNAKNFGTGIYFSTNKDTVQGEFGDNVTEVSLNIENPVNTNTKEWNEVQSLAIRLADEDYGKRRGLTLEEGETVYRYDPENLSEVDEIPSEFISKAAKQLGYDAIIDKGSMTYGNEVLVLDESKVQYDEDTTTPAVEEVAKDQYKPLKVDDTKINAFTKENAVEYQEAERQDERGETETYASSMTVPLRDADGKTIGGISMFQDADGNLSWNAVNMKGKKLGATNFETKGAAKKALVADYNKNKKKAFDRAAKKIQEKSNKSTKLAQDEQVQPQPTGDGTGRTESSTIAPLEGAPSVPGVNGPDPQLLAVAEQYAKDNGIPFKRQAEYVKVDEKRAKRIADAFEAMANDPKNPKVKEAYQNLIKQTIAQYEALVKAGYKFWFIDFNIPSNVEYASTPYNAIRDSRKNKEMGVFATTDGYGDGGLTDVDVENNPLLVDTGIKWPVGGLDGQMKNVLANDLFRAVHDTFGHGLEGSGFRARGEENAWQAHVRLFTGSAIDALTTETRGQNSWLNYGPNGEQNRTAKVEDTIFAEQKIGLMPEWVSKEGLAGDMQTEQQPNTLESLLDADVTTEENKNTILDFLNKADKAITDRLRGGANDALLAIPLSTVQIVIKAVKVLVKGGMLLRDAIKKVAADNNLTESQVSDVLNVAVKEPSKIKLLAKDTYEKYHVAPQSGHTKIDVKGNEPIKKGQTFGTVTYSNKEEGDVVADSFSINDIDKLSNRSSGFITTARNIAQGFISIKPSPKDITEQLFGNGKSYKNLSEINKRKVDKERIKQTTQFKLPWSNNKALASLNKYIDKNKDNKPSNYYNVIKQKSKDIINSFKEEVKNNLRALYNNVSEDFRETSRQWYDGANRLAQGISKSYGISLEQSAGILAALSPKNNWFNNISAAERVIRAWTDHQNTTVTQEMVDRTIAYMERNGDAPFAKDIRAVFSDTKGMPISALVEEYKKTNDPKILTQIGITMRIIDQSEYSPIVYSVSPEGFIDGKYGVIGWSGGAALTNAVSMLIDPSMNNISSRLGNGNKVRNFYGNIIDPQNANFLTADTHAFAAGLMLPASANEAQDFGLFDGGMSVEYAIFKDAYIEVAKEFGILPRELQSITWEAVRGSINTDNRTPSMVKDINRISEELLTNGKSNENRTNEILKKYPIKFTKGEWSNKRGIEAQKRVLGSNEGVSQTADTGRSTTVSRDLRGQDTQLGEATSVTQGIDQVLDLDVTDEKNKNVVFDFLDKADKSITKRLRGSANDALLAIPLSTVQLVVRTLKTLVQGGMMLRDALRKVAADNNISQQLVKDILNVSEIQDKFDALMLKVDAMITRQRSRGIAQNKMVSNIDTYVRKSEVYQEANDAQKKILEREARARAGAAERRAPSIGRVLGVLSDITNISRAEKLLVIKRIRELSKDAAKDLAKELRAMALKGTITVSQAANVLARFGKVNLLNEVSVTNFVDYMAKVFANAEYAAKMDFVRKKLSAAKRNVLNKIGIGDGLAAPLIRLFSVNPTIIPDSVLDSYVELVKIFSEKAEVLTLPEKSLVIDQVNDILQVLDEEQSLVETLLDVVEQYQNKVLDANGNLDLDKTIKNMVDDGTITEDDAAIMRKYRTTFVPRASTKKTQQELDDEKNQMLDDLSNMTVNGSGLSTRDERDLAKDIAELIQTPAVRRLSNNELRNLLKVIDNINNNYIPHYAQVIKEKMNSINKTRPVVSSILRSALLPLSKVVANIKNRLTGKKNATLTMIERNPLIYLDQVFGDFKTQDLYNALLLDASIGDAAYKSELKVVQELLEKAEQKVAESFKLDPDATLLSKYKMMTYMIQLEFLSNPGNEQVNEAAKYINETIKFIESSDASRYTERDVKMLESILNDFAPSGEVDINELYDSFNDAEKDAIKTIRELNESLKDKAEYTAAIIRGDRISPLSNYVHLNVLQDPTQRDASSSSPSDIANMSNMMNPSTKAKSLIKRTRGAKPLNFDIFASAQRGAKFVLMDYNLTEPIRTARMTINNVKKELEVNDRIPKEQRDKINALESAFKRAVDNLLLNSFTNSTTTEEVIDYISKQGYRAVLAGTTRFTSELMSNIGFALITDPKAMSEGTKYTKLMMSENALKVLQNVSSTQTTRIIPTSSLSGGMVDTSILRQSGGIRGGRAMNPVANKINQLWNRSGKKYLNSVEFVADTIISTPDKLIMRPMWFGSFANAFKSETGVSPDFDKIAQNDEAYMEQYKEAIKNARAVADGRVVLTGATDNAFMGVLKGTRRVDDSAAMKAFNNFNNYMTKFLIFEYMTARTGIAAAMGNGMITRKQGIALIAGVTTRMTVYTLLTQVMGTGLMGLLFGGDEEEEDEKSLAQKFGQQLTSAFTSLLFGRDFGQGVRGILNIGLEEFNKEFLDGLREGDYDPYKDAIQYPIIPPERKGRQTDLGDLLLNMSGSFSPAMKTADFMVRKALEAPKKEADAIERTQNEIGIRIPLEVAGNAGFIPLYKDIKKVVMNELYKDLRLADERAADKKRAAEEKLQGYKNSEDMKRYAPELWKDTFGPDSEDYDVNEAKKKLKREKAKIERERKDDLYNYTPKRKGSKSTFGSGEQRKGSFGGRGFGSDNNKKSSFGRD